MLQAWLEASCKLKLKFKYALMRRTAFPKAVFPPKMFG